MNYLFFDIECCDGVHICSFGYVIVDKNFHIIKKEDIIINPQKAFRLGNQHKDELKLFYPKSKFYESQPFPHFYKTLKSLLTDPQLSLVGFAIDNDFNFLNRACVRYKLPQLSLVGLDVQLLEKAIAKDTEVHSLDKVADRHEIPHGILNLHRSCDDAQLTMYILRGICFENNLKIDSIPYPQCLVQSKPFNLPKCKKIRRNFVTT